MIFLINDSINQSETCPKVTLEYEGDPQRFYFFLCQPFEFSRLTLTLINRIGVALFSTLVFCEQAIYWIKSGFPKIVKTDDTNYFFSFFFLLMLPAYYYYSGYKIKY